MSYQWTDIAGNIGVLMILVTYALLQFERINPKSVGYSAMNAFGAGLILISLTVNFNLSAFLIEFFWLVISVGGLWRGWQQRHSAA